MKKCTFIPDLNSPLKQFRRISLFYNEEFKVITLIIYPTEPDPETGKVQSFIMSGTVEEME